MLRSMADPNKPGAQTTEFILTLLSNVVGGIAASGLITDSQVVKAFGIAGIVLANALYTWQRTQLKITKAEGADATATAAASPSTTVVTPIAVVDAKTSQGGFVDASMMAAFTIIAGVLAMIVGFGACSSVKGVAHDVANGLVDCTKKETSAAVHELRPLGDAMLVNALDGSKVDWAPVRDIAKGFVTDVGRCVLADAVGRALAPKPTDPNAPKLSPLEVDANALRSGFRQLSTELYGGAQFKTEAGQL